MQYHIFRLILVTLFLPITFQSMAQQSANKTDRFQNRSVLVTGGSSGLGRAIALAFAAEGADVAITYEVVKDGADQTCSEVVAVGGRCYVFREKFGKATQQTMQELIQRVKKSIPKIHVLVNNAGVVSRTGILSITEEEYQRVMNVNLKAPLFLTQAFIEEAIKDGLTGANVVNISSISDHISLNNSLTMYDISKAALSMLSHTAAIDVADQKIRVNTVSPGLVATRLNRELREKKPDEWDARNSLIPLGPGTPKDIADAVLFLASDDAKWITGQKIYVDGGQIGSLLIKK